MKGYLIWSEEHGAWWGPGAQDYTRSLLKAGRYGLLEATEIVQKANQYLHETEFSELIVIDPIGFNEAILA